MKGENKNNFIGFFDGHFSSEANLDIVKTILAGFENGFDEIISKYETASSNAQAIELLDKDQKEVVSDQLIAESGIDLNVFESDLSQFAHIFSKNQVVGRLQPPVIMYEEILDLLSVPKTAQILE